MKASWSTTQNVEAKVGLALVDARDFGFGWRLYPERTLAESIALLNKALAIDPSFSHGYYAKGVALLTCQRSGVIVRDGLSASPAWTAACASLTRSRCARAAGGQSFIAADCERPASNRAAEPPFGWLEVLAVGFSSKWTNPVWPSGAAVPAAWR
jgi:hypothetical protein